MPVTMARPAEQHPQTRQKLRLVLGKFTFVKKSLFDYNMIKRTWNGDEKFDSIFMTVERKLSLGHGAVRNETAGHYSISRITGEFPCKDLVNKIKCISLI